jgi:predicted O-methyltransferase YrrM
VQSATDKSFDATLADVADVEGWMTDAQARRLWDSARRVAPGGRIVEIGSFRGRSTTVLARAAADDVEVVAIDPHLGTDRGPQEIVTTAGHGNSDNDQFRANLTRAGVQDRVRHVRKLSNEAAADVADPIDLLYIDGAHRFGPARADIRGWGTRVAPGGTLLVHDTFSSVGVTAAIATELLDGRAGFEYVGRSGTLAEYRRSELDTNTRVTNAGRQLAQLPYFLRNLTIKVLIVLRLRSLTRLLGQPTAEWPY